jgi:L-fucose isomerase-like protein
MAFRTVRYSEKLLESTGISVVTLDMSEIFGATAKMTDNEPAVAAKLAAINGYGKLAAGIKTPNIVKQAKLSVAIDRFLADNDCDCSAIQCWNSVQENYGCATCLSMSMMGEQLMPSACEVDVTGVVSMYALALASRQAPGFLDWNNNYADRADHVVGTHCSNYPKSFMGKQVEIGNLDLLGETFGAERCFGAIKGQVAPGPFTFFRVSTDDRKGLIRSYLGEGEFTADPFPMDGGIAVCKINRTRELMTHVTRNGFEHHVAMVRGGHRAILREAIANYLGWDLYDHV